MAVVGQTVDRVRQAFDAASIEAVKGVAPDTTRRVYGYLLSCADWLTGRVNVSAKRIAKECKLSLSQTKRATSNLRAYGWLHVDKRGVRGRSVTQQYVTAGSPILPGMEPQASERQETRGVVPQSYWDSVLPPAGWSEYDYADLWESLAPQGGPPF